MVEIFPDVPSLVRLVGALLVETNDEWQVGRRYFSETSMRELYEPDLILESAPMPLPVAPIH